MVIANEALDLRIYGARHSAREKLADFSQFENEWHHGEGQRFPQNVVGQVDKLLDECFGNYLFEVDLFPGLDADIRLTVYEEADYYEFTIGDTISYVHEENSIEIENEENITFVNAVSKIRDIGRQKWASSESLMHTSGTTSVLSGFKVLLLNAAQGYLSFKVNVQAPQADAPALT